MNVQEGFKRFFSGILGNFSSFKVEIKKATREHQPISLWRHLEL